MLRPHHDTVGTSIEKRLHDPTVRWLAIDGNANRPRVPPYLLRHGIELAAALFDLGWRDPIGQPTIGMRHHAAQHILGMPADDHRRVRLLSRFGKGSNEWKIEI